LKADILLYCTAFLIDVVNMCPVIQPVTSYAMNRSSYEMNGLNHCVGMVMKSLKRVILCCAVGNKWPEAV
jgi:hypothetical protein